MKCVHKMIGRFTPYLKLILNMKKITESRLKEIINESVDNVLNRMGLINEMAVPLKEYKA